MAIVFPFEIEFSAQAPSHGGAAYLCAVFSPAEEDGAVHFPAAVGSAVGMQLSKMASLKKFTGSAQSLLELMAPASETLPYVVAVGCGKQEDVTLVVAEKSGGKGATALLKSTQELIVDVSALSVEQGAAFVGGLLQRLYTFNVYRTKLKEEDISQLARLFVVHPHMEALKARLETLILPLVEGIYLARDLVNEPANVLYPESFALKCKELEEYGVKVKILGEKEMTALGMNALLGVGQGSRKESQLVVMEWNGSGDSHQAPLAFIGKGVCFDTGGISIKPAAGMEEMTMDMGGAAAVTGTLLALARRKAPVHVVGVIGLVENMPDGNAQRPGDVVRSMSGQTIEVINTDAEGRLVLADAMWYTHTTYAPRLMIDLATLTGAIIMTLAQEYAGLFSNDETLSQQLLEAGKATGEKLWAFPMDDVYDKTLKSRVADMANIAVGAKGGGSITAACFLKRFVPEGLPWAHLDIAGTAYIKSGTALHGEGGTGFGVKLLNQLVDDLMKQTA